MHPCLAPLLREIQLQRVFDDSKTAVDLVLCSSAEQTAAAAQQLLESSPSRDELRSFVDEHFAAPGSDLQACQPADWLAEPPGFLSTLQTAAAAAAAGASSPQPEAAASDAGPPYTAAPLHISRGDEGGRKQPSAAELLAFGRQVHALWNVLSRQQAAPAATASATASATAAATAAAAPPPSASQAEAAAPGAAPRGGGGGAGRASTLLSLPHPTVVPGDRFRETYYWDSYWVLLGLLASGMTATAAGLVRNLMHLLDCVGHVPNGARAYYTNRSQPPLLSAMVRRLHAATGDGALLRDALPLLVREHRYWTSGPKAVSIRAADGSVHRLSRYWATWYDPRPESYREDLETAAAAAAAAGAAPAAAVAAASAGAAPAHTSNSLGSPGSGEAGGGSATARDRETWHELATAAESGWDFSSRWFTDGASLATIQASIVIPADLNAFIFQMERDIQWMACVTGDAETETSFEAAADARRTAMMSVLWDDESACWRDGVMFSPGGSSSSGRWHATLPTSSHGRRSCPEAASSGPRDGADSSSGDTVATAARGEGGEGFSYSLRLSCQALASNYVPLWAGLTAGDPALGERVVRSLEASGLVQPGGVATSLVATGQQWDFPNGWPPLQHMAAEGARRYGGRPGEELARRIARAWVRSNHAAWEATGHMHEKYDVRGTGGGAGGGGEYRPQVGFGWSNGVLLHFLDGYYCCE